MTEKGCFLVSTELHKPTFFEFVSSILETDSETNEIEKEFPINDQIVSQNNYVNQIGAKLIDDETKLLLSEFLFRFT